jgi:hypothetical protein
MCSPALYALYDHDRLYALYAALRGSEPASVHGVKTVKGVKGVKTVKGVKGSCADGREG